MSERRIRTTARIELSDDRGVFMISVAAELAEMHPQTLRMYEQRGLIQPKRSPKGTRLYSHADVERLNSTAGFAPRTPIEEGIARFVAWYRAYHGC